jgi:peptidoglycan hydrolase-like protein with peptidoglycan-binding domain
MADRYYPARDESVNIYELQEFLRYISEHTKGIPNVVPDGIYGPETQETVMAFQSKFGLPRTGEADLDTWTMVVEVYDDLIKRHRLPKKISGYPLEIPHLKEGDDFEEIYLLQIMLRRIAKLFKNITMPEITGVYDDKTSKAVEEFSRLYGKNSNGKVDRELWSILTDTYNSFTHNG